MLIRRPLKGVGRLSLRLHFSSGKSAFNPLLYGHTPFLLFGRFDGGSARIPDGSARSCTVNARYLIAYYELFSLLLFFNRLEVVVLIQAVHELQHLYWYNTPDFAWLDLENDGFARPLQFQYAVQ